MKLFLDTADIFEIEQVLSYGILEGVTTNPLLMKKAVEENRIKNIGKHIEKILKLCEGLPVSLEVVGVDYDSMVREGRLLYEKFNSIAGNVYVKIPVNPCMEPKCDKNSDGIRAIKTLSEEGIPVNCTLIFTPEQALLAAKAGANFISSFVGGEDDYIREMNNIKFEKNDYFPAEGFLQGRRVLEDAGIVSGVDLIWKTVDILEKSEVECEVLAASIRNREQLREVALAGADIVTVSFDIIEELIEHPKTIEGMDKLEGSVILEYEKIFGTKFKGGKNNV